MLTVRKTFKALYLILRLCLEYEEVAQILKLELSNKIKEIGLLRTLKYVWHEARMNNTVDPDEADINWRKTNSREPLK